MTHHCTTLRRSETRTISSPPPETPCLHILGNGHVLCLIPSIVNNCMHCRRRSELQFCKPPILPTLVFGILFLRAAACRQSRKRIRRQLGARGFLSQALIGHWPEVCVPGYLAPAPGEARSRQATSVTGAFSAALLPRCRSFIKSAPRDWQGGRHNCGSWSRSCKAP